MKGGEVAPPVALSAKSTDRLAATKAVLLGRRSSMRWEGDPAKENPLGGQYEYEVEHRGSSLHGSVLICLRLQSSKTDPWQMGSGKRKGGRRRRRNP